MIVVDASALVQALVGKDEASRQVRDLIAAEDLFAPQGVDLECVSALRGLVSGNKLATPDAANALGLLTDLPLQRLSVLPVLMRIWELRHNASPYDAAYVAIAELLAVTLVTADIKLGRIPHITCEVHVIGSF